MPVEVAGTVFSAPIAGVRQRPHDLGARGPGPGVVRVHVLDVHIDVEPFLALRRRAQPPTPREPASMSNAAQGLDRRSGKLFTQGP